MSDPRVAALWLAALQRLADRAAHEINNALNGVVVNLEVVRARATPGADAGRVAAFGEAAVEQGELATTLVGALLGLARSPRGAAAATTDVALVARHVAALLAPAVAHHGVVVELDAPDPAPADGDPLAVRAAVALALLLGADAAAGDGAGDAPPAPHAAELGGANPADESSRRVRGTVTTGPRLIVQVAQSHRIALPTDVAATLRGAGVAVDADGGTITLTFRAAGGSA